MAKRTQESIIDLASYVDKKIRVKFVGGREVVGILKGADPVCNLVLDEAVEFLRDAKDPLTLTDHKRNLGILIARGPTVLAICKEDGFDSGIENPYAQHE
jgi:U6 snRNA-associated Sm-like protein LSm7